MKRTNYIINGLAAIVAILMFAQCTDKAGGSTTTTENSGETASATGLKLAYVDLDSLLTKYDFWNDIAGEMMKKEENVRATVNQKTRELEKDAQDFQRKVDNNAFVSQERAQQEYNRIGKKQQDLQNLQNRLMEELATENAKNGNILKDSINAFLEEYNKTKGYHMIFSNNVLFSQPEFNITQEVVDGLNARYKAANNAAK